MILYTITFITGIFVKVVDIIEDKKIKALKGLSYLFGVIYGSLIGFVIANFENIAPLWIGAIIGIALAKKIDAVPHILGIISALITILIFGIGNINYFLLLIFALASFTDEKVDLSLKKLKKKNIIVKILDLRLILEITAFIISLITNLWGIFFAMLAFDVGYKLTEFLLKSLFH